MASACFVVDPAKPRDTEDQIFEAVRQPPIALLQQLYNEHQLLVVSFQEHDNERQYRVLSTLLERIGHDPRLRYIVFERFAESGPALEAASIKNLDESQLEQEVMQPFQNSPSPSRLCHGRVVSSENLAGVGA